VTISAALALVAFWYTGSQAKQQRIIQEQQAREAALLSYFDAMSVLMFDRKLLTSDAEDPVRDVARARTLVGLLAVGTERQRDVIRFLYESDVIKPETPENRIVDLTKANLTDAHLNRMPLSGIDLRGANLSDGLDVDTRGATLKAAGLQNAYLGDANLARADLEDANLESANLTDGLDVNNTRGAILKAADLQNANLKYADLTGANLTEANFTEANLTEANLTEAKGVTQQELEEQTQKLEGAIMPDGSRHD
jgi:Pentapeptide repeats (8 copies)